MNSLLFQNKFDELKLNENLNLFLNKLQKINNVVIFGGTLRDWTLGQSPKDIDFVADCSEEELKDLCKSFKFILNAFGGYKIIIDNIKIDIWALSSTWAFKYFADKSLNNLHNTSFHNLTSITYNINSNEIYENNFYFGIDNKLLDIIFEKNLFPKDTIHKSFFMAQKYDLRFSDKLKFYLNDKIKELKYKESDFNSFQKIHYKKIIYSFNDCMTQLQ